MSSSIRHWITLCEVELPNSIWPKAARRLIANVDWSGGGGETAIAMMGYEQDEIDELNTKSREFKAQLLKWAEGRAWNAFNEIDYRFKGDVIRVYRVITAPADWKPDPARHPGEYWSWDENAAEAHWGEFGPGHVKWMLIADVRKSQIDWVQTLAANGAPDSESESEIKVRPNTTIKFSYRRVK